MASALHDAGWQVAGFDPSLEARARAEEGGITAVAELSDLPTTAFALLSLPSAALVARTVPELLARDGLVAIVDTTTSEPATSAEMARIADERGIAFVDAPVSGGRTGARAGRLSAFVGGTDSAIAAADPLLQALTQGGYRHLGGPGSGNVVKLLNNVLAAANLATVGEALAIAQAYGVDPAAAAESISSASGGSRASSASYPDWVLSGTFDSGFALGLMARDAALAVDVARQRGEDPSLLARVSERWQQALNALGPAADFTEIARVVAPTLTTAQEHAR